MVQVHKTPIWLHFAVAVLGLLSAVLRYISLTATHEVLLQGLSAIAWLLAGFMIFMYWHKNEGMGAFAWIACGMVVALIIDNGL